MNLTDEQVRVIRANARDEAACQRILDSLMEKTTSMSPKQQILAVDDDPHMCSLIRFVLESEGKDVFSATTGKIALEIINSKHLNLIFLDVNMPDINGGELLEEIRKSSLNKETPVVFITGLIKPDEESKLPQRREKYLGKPLTVEKLLSVTKEILG